jgi:NodT family efflux transporter outer membrane factor (OMF) lipoprotein
MNLFLAKITSGNEVSISMRRKVELMKQGRINTGVAALLVATLLSGCAPKQGRYTPPTAPQLTKTDSWSAPPSGGEIVKPADDASLSHWWSVFQDPLLSSLEERALKANLDIRKADAEIRQARANRDYNAANLFPSIKGSFGATGTHTGSGAFNPTSASLASALSGSGLSRWSATYSPQIQASWEPDFFGSLRKNVASYEATAQAQHENLRNVMVTLTADVALDYIDVRSYQEQLRVTRENLVKYNQTYEMTLEKRDSGLASDLDVQQALETVQSTEASIPSLETSLQQSCNAISVLLAEKPGSVDVELAEVKPIPVIPPEVAVGIPADLIRRRPDIRQAERQYAAQWMQVGVAKANLYPTFSLSGTFSFSSQSILNAFDPKYLASNFAGSVEQTLINRKALRAQLRAQNALLDQNEVAYEGTVLSAIQDVENALKAFDAEQDRRKSLAAAAGSAENAAEMSRELYAGGLKDFLTVLDSERTVLSAQNSLVQSDANVAEDLVRLYKAMGGGWK